MGFVSEHLGHYKGFDLRLVKTDRGTLAISIVQVTLPPGKGESSVIDIGYHYACCAATGAAIDALHHAKERIDRYQSSCSDHTTLVSELQKQVESWGKS